MKSLCTTLLAALLAATACSAVAADPPSGLKNPFFAMDTGTRDAKHATPESQAAMLQELGYAGIGWGPGGIPEMLAALDRHGLKMFTIYVGLTVEPEGFKYDPALPKAIEQLKGRGTIVWLTVTSKKWKASDPAGDDVAVAGIREVAGLADKAGLRVALYPHTWFWVERVQDAVRVVRKVDRANVGVTFNLCHCLKVGDEPRIPALLKEAAPHLFVVSINGADHEGDWDRLIQPLDRGSFDVASVLKELKALGYSGPIGLQHYGVRGDAQENLRRSMEGWRALAKKAAE